MLHFRPLCSEGIARGAFMVDKFMICLPFNNGGTGETNGSVNTLASQQLMSAFLD